MGKAKFTKGEWFSKPEQGVWLSSLCSKSGVILSIFKRKPKEADLNLILAAPDMYELLEDLAQEYHCKCGHKSCRIELTRKEIDDLLAKARGDS